MRDLYKKSNFPTRFDIFGEECFVSRVEYDEKFDVEILFGRPVDKTIGAKRIILTTELKQFIEASLDVPLKEFTGVLTSGTVNASRRKLKANPFLSYQEWVKSKDPDKPKEITLTNTKSNPEYMDDYLGTRYIILSAKATDEGLVFPMGIPEHMYRADKQKTKRYILSSVLVSIIKEYRFYAFKAIHRLPFGTQTFISLKKELGYLNNEVDDTNLWLSAHLDKILTMTNQKFYEQYGTKVHISKNTIATVKTSCHNLKRLSVSKDQKEQKVYRLLKVYVRSSNKDQELKQTLKMLIGPYYLKSENRAANLFLLAKKHNHSLPKGYKRII